MITITEIISEWGKYKNMGQTIQDIYNKLVLSFPTKNAMTVMNVQDSTKRVILADRGGALQPFKPTFSPIADGTWRPREIPLQRVKIDRIISPHEIWDTYLGFMANVSSKDVKQWPFTRWYLDYDIIPMINNELDQAVWDSEYVAPTNNATPGTFATIFDGLKKQLLDAWADANSGITKVTGLSAFTDDNILDSINAFKKQQPAALKAVPKQVFMAHGWATSYLESKQITYLYNNGLEADARIPYTNDTIVGLHNMDIDETEIVFSTPKSNIAWLIRTGENMYDFDMQPSDYQLKFMGWFQCAPAILDFRQVTAWIPAAELPVVSGSGS